MESTPLLCTIAFTMPKPTHPHRKQTHDALIPTLSDYPGVSKIPNEFPSLPYRSPHLLDKSNCGSFPYCWLNPKICYGSWPSFCLLTETWGGAGSILRHLGVGSGVDILGWLGEGVGTKEFLVCNHVTRRPCWWSKQKKFFCLIYVKIEFISQRREMFLFLTTNMAAVTSLTNQQ